MHSIQEVVREIYALGRVNRELQRRAVPEHPPACLQALGVIARGEAVRVSDIAEQLRIDLSVASRQVAVLETRGGSRARPTPPTAGRGRWRSPRPAGPCSRDTLARMADAYTGVLAGWKRGRTEARCTPSSRACARISPACPEPALTGSSN